MAYRMNEKIRHLVPYQPISGNFRIRMDANESFFPPGKELLEKIGSAVRSVPLNRYPDPYALESCRAFAGFYGCRPENVVAGNGSDELIALISEAFSMKGEKILTFSPDFSMYSFYGRICETENIVYRKEEDLSVDVDRVIRLARENGARMLLFSNPCNPTGKGLRRDEVRKLIRSVDALVVLDEAYMDFWDQSLIGEADRYDNLILLRTCSKAFGLAGIRLGFAVANEELARALRAVKSPYNVNAMTQAAGAAVLGERLLLQSRTRAIVRSREELYRALRALEKGRETELRVYPTVTNFVLLRTDRAEEFHRRLLENGISVRLFDGFLRVTAGSERENAEFIKAFGAML